MGRASFALVRSSAGLGAGEGRAVPAPLGAAGMAPAAFRAVRVAFSVSPGREMEMPRREMEGRGDLVSW